MTGPRLHVWVPLLPPTSNNIYIRHPAGKGRVLSDKARKFKMRAMAAVQKEGRLALLQLQQNVPYRLHLAIFFEQVENKDSKAGNRYKKMDLSNRMKLIEDTLSKAVGLDDCHNFVTVMEKHCDPANPGIYATLERVDEDSVGLSKEAYELRLPKPEHERACRAGNKRRMSARAPRIRTGAARGPH